MTEKVPAALSGLVVLDPGFAHGNIAGETVTQRGPEPDQPQPDASNAGYLELQQGGSDVTATSYTVQASKAGAAGANDRAGRYIWRKSTETAATDFRGWLPYRTPSRFRALAHTTAGVGMRAPTAIRLPDHTLVVVYADRPAAQLRVARLLPGAASWTISSVRPQPLSPTIGHGYDIVGALVMVPRRRGGVRLLLPHLTVEGVDVSGAEVWAIQVWYSDDNGATWAESAASISGFSLPYTADPATMSAVYHDGYITLAIAAVVPSSGSEWWHLVSRDLLASVEEIEHYPASTHDVGRPDLHVLPSGAVLWVYLDGLRVKYATQDHSDAKIVDADDYNTALGGSVSNCDRFASTVGIDGRLYAAQLLQSSDRLDLVVVDLSDPSVQVETDDTYRNRGLLRTGDASERLFAAYTARAACMVAGLGRLHLICQADSTGPADESLYHLEFGGPSSLEWSPYGVDFIRTGTGDDGAIYLPISLPSAWAGLTVIALGSPTATIDADGLRLIGGSMATYSIQQDYPGDRPNRVIGPFGVDVVSGGAFSTSQAETGVALVFDDGTNHYEGWLQLMGGAAQVVDRHGAAVLGTLTGWAADRREYVIETNRSGSSAPWFRAWMRADQHDGRWTEIGGGQLTASASTGAVDHVRWGLLSSGGSREVVWEAMPISGFVDHGRPRAADLGASWWPSGLTGRPFHPAPAYLDDGRTLRARGGSALVGDVWTVGTRYEFGLQNLDPQQSASPAVAWETTETGGIGGSDYLIPWNFDLQPRRVLSGSVGVYLGGVGQRLHHLEGYDGATWATLATIDAADGLAGLSFSRSGDVITASGGIAADRWIELDELVGGFAVLDVGGSPVARPILANGAGVWGPSGGPQVWVRLGGGVALLPASGLCDIVRPSVAVLVHDVTIGYQRWRLRVPKDQTTTDDRYKIGVCLVGPFLAFSPRVSRGRKLSAAPNVEIAEGRSGRRTATERGPMRRRVSLPFLAVDGSSIGGSNPTPDHIAPRAGYAAVGAVNDATLASAVLRRTVGPLHPVYYVARLPTPGPGVTVQHAVGAWAGLYGRIVSKFTAKAVLGEEGESELLAIDALVIEEEL